MKDSLCIAKQFSDMVRYIDDLLTLNSCNFEGEIMNIYPTELKLKKTIESSSNLSYLDSLIPRLSPASVQWTTFEPVSLRISLRERLMSSCRYSLANA